jgi:hypothetical protein
MATEIATADAAEATINNEPARGTSAATSAAGRTTTDAVANTASGRYRSKRVGAGSSQETTALAGHPSRLRATLRARDENSSKDENMA